MEKGYLYIATGEKYLKEFEVSCASLKKVDPTASISLITDGNYKPVQPGIEVIRSDEDSTKPFLYKINGLSKSPYLKTLFVDTDTFFCSNCSEIFVLLESFDLCIVPCNDDNSIVYNKDSKAVNGLFPYNTGVIGYSKNMRTSNLLHQWKEAYLRHFDKYIHDQPPFMEALLSVDIKTLTLSSIYNARTPYTCAFIGKPVKIIHGRHRDYHKIEKKLNRHKDQRRLWHPRYERVIVHRRTRLFKWYMKLDDRHKQRIKSLLLPIAQKLGIEHFK